jgi:hypothetical protein
MLAARPTLLAGRVWLRSTTDGHRQLVTRSRLDMDALQDEVQWGATTVPIGMFCAPVRLPGSGC